MNRIREIIYQCRDRLPAFPMNVSVFSKDRGMGASIPGAGRNTVSGATFRASWRLHDMAITDPVAMTGEGHAHGHANPFRCQKYNLLIKNICAHSDIREGFSS